MSNLSPTQKLPEEAPAPLWAPLEVPLAAVGQVTLNLMGAFRFIAQAKIHIPRVIAQMSSIGVDSLPMVLVINGIAGSVLSLQTADKFSQTGADAYVGGLVAIAIVREIAPVFTGLAVGARAGTAIAAELANMQTSEQIAIMELFKVSPLRYLFMPRLIACMVMIPLLSVLGMIVGNIGGMIMALSVARLHPQKYLESVWLTLSHYDLQISLLKSLVFGILLAGVSGSIGLATRGGAREVGQATTRAAVWTAIAIILADFILSWVFFATGGSSVL